MNRIPANFKDLILETVVQYGGEIESNLLYDKALTTSDYEEKLRIMRALTHSTNATFLQLYLI